MEDTDILHLHIQGYHIPNFVEKLSDGNFMEVGAQLRTRDGRLLGNAFVNSVKYDKTLRKNVAECYTDIGNKFTLTIAELEEFFYPPIYVLKIDEHRKKIGII